MNNSYRKKPVVIEAMQWMGVCTPSIYEFFGEYRDWGMEEGKYTIFIKTLEGTMTGGIGDYIIKGVKGEYYPCRRDIFEETYEPVK